MRILVSCVVLLSAFYSATWLFGVPQVRRDLHENVIYDFVKGRENRTDSWPELDDQELADALRSATSITVKRAIPLAPGLILVTAREKAGVVWTDEEMLILWYGIGIHKLWSDWRAIGHDYSKIEHPG